MYIHAGNNRMIRTRTIIGVFDMDTATMTGATRDFLRKAERSGRMINVNDDIPKSFVLTEDGSVYVSQISTAALVGRAGALYETDRIIEPELNLQAFETDKLQEARIRMGAFFRNMSCPSYKKGIICLSR